MKDADWRVAPYFIVDDVVTTANFYRDKLGFSCREGEGRTRGRERALCYLRDGSNIS